MAETTEQSGTENLSHRGRPKTRTGIVTSNKMQKTVVVTVRRRAAHRKYGKIGCKVWVCRGEVLPTKGGGPGVPVSGR